MDNNNRYEEVPQKENVFAKAFKTFGKYLKGVAVDFVNSFKYNNMKAAAIFVALPGIFLGFFLSSHIPTAMHVYDSFTKNGGAHEEYVVNLAEEKITKTDGNIELTLANRLVKSKNTTDYTAMEAQEKLTELKSLGNISFAGADGKLKLTASFDSLTDEEDVKYVKNYGGYYIDIFKDGVLVDSYQTTDANYEVSNTTLPNGSYTYTVSIFPTNDAADSYYASKPSAAKALTVSGSKVEESQLTFYKYAGSYKGKTSDGADFVLVLNPSSAQIDVNLDGNKITVGDATITVGGSEKVANYSVDGNNLTCYLKLEVKILPFDYSAMAVFALMLLGFLNVFVSLSLSKLKNFGSVIKATIISALIIILGSLYIYSIFATQSYISSGELIIEGLKDGTIIDKDAIISITVVIISMVSVVIGLILSFINYDRTYEKVDR